MVEAIKHFASYLVKYQLNLQLLLGLEFLSFN